MKQKKLWMLVVILTFCGTTVLTSCSKDDDESPIVPPAKEYFTLWNQCEALTALQDYVKDVTDPNSKNFIKEEDRIATFDMDGTFIGERRISSIICWNTALWTMSRIRPPRM